MNYFLKELVSNKLSLPNGRKVAFEPLPDGNGVLATTDAFVISELRICNFHKTHGVSEISSEQYDDLKKKANAVSSPRPRSGQRQGVSALNLPQIRSRPADAVGDNKKDSPTVQPPPIQPIKPQSEFVRPVTRKLFKD